MDRQQLLFKTIPHEKYADLSKEDLIILYEGEQQIIKALRSQLKEATAKYTATLQKSFFIDEKYVVLKYEVFGKSSERSSKNNNNSSAGEGKKPKKKVKLPSERYPDATIIETDAILPEPPSCKCCGNEMEDSGMTEDSEQLTVIPKKILVEKIKRHIYRCPCCHGDLQTTPAPPKITPGGTYSDLMIIDVAASKYCDLVPIDRYVQIAARDGYKGLPPNSLINATHNLAEFVVDAYTKIGDEIASSAVVHADETPHRMLEGDKKDNWLLWGFSTDKAAYFEMHDTRSGDVAIDILKDSKCEYLMTDVYSGYGKAVRLINEHREGCELAMIYNIYCNAHARRKFKDVEKMLKVNPDKILEKELVIFLWCYRRIYKLEKHKKDDDYPLPFERIRTWQRFYFNVMQRRAEELKINHSSKSKMYKALSYLTKNFVELTRFLDHKHLPIDNNQQEGLLRNPVIGRKIWYGTHSKKGARTAAILFTLVESCKLNKINPRQYLKELVWELHQGLPAFTPAEYLERIKNSS